MTKLRLMFFWLLAPALGALLAAPLVLGHVVVRLLIARMRRPDPDLRGAAATGTDEVRATRPSWSGPVTSA